MNSVDTKALKDCPDSQTVTHVNCRDRSTFTTVAVTVKDTAMSSNILDRLDRAKPALMIDYEARLKFIHRPRHAVMCMSGCRLAPYAAPIALS